LTNSAPTPARVVLDGVLGIRTVDTVRRTLQEALAEHPAVQIDCTMATSVDLSLIQLLLAARQSARLAGKQLALAAPASGALRSALVQAGLLPSDGAEQTKSDPFWSGSS
jgi:anti-anti-sigma regulatory factor